MIALRVGTPAPGKSTLAGAQARGPGTHPTMTVLGLELPGGVLKGPEEYGTCPPASFQSPGVRAEVQNQGVGQKCLW